MTQVICPLIQSFRAPNVPQSGSHHFRSDRKSAIGSDVSLKVPSGPVHIIAPGFNPGNKAQMRPKTFEVSETSKV